MKKITGLGMGGAERQVVDLADSFDKKNYCLYFRTYCRYTKISKYKVNFIKWFKINFWNIQSNKHYKNNKSRYSTFSYVSCEYYYSYSKNICKCTAHSKNEGGKIRMFLYRITNFLADSFTNVSQEAVEAFEQKGATKTNQMIAMHNGIDCNIFTFDINEREKYNLKNKKIFIHVGRFTEAKDHINLLIAYKNIFRYSFSFSWRWRTQIEDFILNNNLSQNVSLLGIQKNISSLLSMSDIFVLSSSWEGFGLVIGEAMACERVVVATDCGGVSEVLGDCGFLVELKNNQVLTEAYYLNEQEAKNIGKIARKRVLDKYSVVREWENVYKGIKK